MPSVPDYSIIGRRIKEEITDLKMLLMSYREGIIKEKQ